MERPTIADHYAFTWRGFQELSTCRRDPGALIPWTAIDTYARRYGIDGDDFTSFEAVIRFIDAGYIEARDKKYG